MHSRTQNRRWDDETCSNEYEFANTPVNGQVHLKTKDENDSFHTANRGHRHGRQRKNESRVQCNIP